MENRYILQYQSNERTFEIKFYEIIDEQIIIDCHHDFRKCFKKNFNGNEYKILLDMRGYRHNNMAAEKKIRMLFTDGWKSQELNKCIACAVVNDDFPRIEHLQEFNTSKIERFFENMDAALKWLKKF